MTQIILIYGGVSSERDVSIQTAFTMLRWLQPFNYAIKLVYIDPSNNWNMKESEHTEQDPKELIHYSSLGIKEFVRVATTPDTLVIPLLHGKLGEDGTIQGFLEMLNISYVGNRVEASACSLNKSITKSIFEMNGIPVVKGVTVYKDEIEKLKEVEVLDKFRKLEYPLIVKPVREGSSIGIQSIENSGELYQALNEAFSYDNVLLVEEKIKCREIFAAALQQKDRLIISKLGEVKVENDYYTYDDKYALTSTAQKQLVFLPQNIEREIFKLGEKIFGILGGKDLMRIDFFLTESNEIFVNEVNTMPSLQESSMYPFLLKETGISEHEIAKTLIENNLV